MRVPVKADSTLFVIPCLFASGGTYTVPRNFGVATAQLEEA